MAVRIKVIRDEHRGNARPAGRPHFADAMTGRQVDFRVACQPTIHGENIVLRILDRQKGIVPLEKLGLTAEIAALLKLMIARPEGIILVTGPTGSGKTTTLYSVLNHINSDGGQHHDAGGSGRVSDELIRQTSVNEAAKLDFANGIRSMMRQDPDVILVGEIRDADTADHGVSRRHDRPPGVFDATHQLRHRRHPTPARHWRAAGHHGRQHDRHRRPAPDPAPVRTLQIALPRRAT
jgi:type IV pilus assembly protein PilB